MLGADESLSDGTGAMARTFQEHTESHWRQWTRRLAIPPEWQDAVLRAAITLKLCTFEETGAIVAAMTTSIPEAPGSGRNWDYRYCWLRDAFFVVRALNSLSEVDTMEHYLRYLGNIVGQAPDGHLQPVYGIALERRLDEREVTTLAGYRGMGPGPRGQPGLRAPPARRLRQRRARDARRPSSTGACCVRRRRTTSRASSVSVSRPYRYTRRRTRACGSCARASACTPRPRSCAGPPATASRASRSTARCRNARGFGRTARRQIRGAIESRAFDPARGSFMDSFGGTDVEAGLLLMAEVGFLPPGDPRFAGTVAAIEKRLRRGPHLFRYAAADDFGLPTTAFNICTFWYIDALARTGRAEEARELFERMLANRNHVGPAVGGHRSRERRALGQLPADLLAGRHRERGDAPVARLGGIRVKPARLVVVSNRVGPGAWGRRRGRTRGRAGRCPARARRALVRLERAHGPGGPGAPPYGERRTA